MTFLLYDDGGPINYELIVLTSIAVKGRSSGVSEWDESAHLGLTTVAVQAFLAPLDEASGRADLVARRLAEAIRLGLILDRERLPPETKLAEQLGVSTVTLREALAVLREQGLVTTRRGRGGGTFVQAPADLVPGLVRRLRRFSIHGLRDLGDHRAAVSGTAARLAAERALPHEVDNLARQVERLRAATTGSERRRADTQFTIEVAAAAQSPRLTREELRLRAEVGDLLWLQLDAADHQASVRARGSLVEAIERHEPLPARDLAEEHVREDTTRLVNLRLRIYELDRTGQADQLLGQDTGVS
ncbi:FadR family transcriptional regulator [Streptosporangiaceae bacterium NEAU-GS5]|nr:FadR family transcriptional regulator [Streptosporangiaceae bacterium NEAU-GS5]